jgi:hypothetical protein
MNAIAQTLSQAGVEVESWLPKNFDLANIFNLYGRVSAYLLLVSGGVKWSYWRSQVRSTKWLVACNTLLVIERSIGTKNPLVTQDFWMVRHA